MKDFKTEQLDLLPIKFNLVNDALNDAIKEVINSWEDERSKQVRKLKMTFDEMQACIKSFLVEIRLNILLLDKAKKATYRDYCLISYKLFNEPLSPQEVEVTLFKEFGESALTYEESYFNADIAVSDDIGLYESCNYIFCFSLLMTYYHALIWRIIHSIPTADINSNDLTSMDLKKNTVSQKTLVLYYLVKTKKLSLNKLSQDATKQAKILSFLFDSSYENLRKALTGINESSSSRLKVSNNLDVVSDLFRGLGTEFSEINDLLNKDMEERQKK
ncbi:hypothetical protein D3C87_406390 [compost metagenome]